MRAGEAKAIARQWVADVAARAPGFAGAFFHGSINDVPDDAELAPWSDIDIGVAGALPAGACGGKRAYRGVLLDVAYFPPALLLDAASVLADYRLAPSFARDSVIGDPAGALREMHARVAPAFAEPRWVSARCDDAVANAMRYAASAASATTFEDAAMAWLFANGVLTHIVLAAALRNPTVRTRYAAARPLLQAHGHAAVYAAMLASLGVASIPAADARRHLDAMTQAFDAAARVADGTPFPFAADIAPAARPVAVDGSAGLIARGLHREAMFWIAVTAARCRMILLVAAPLVAAKHETPFRALFASMGIRSLGDVRAGIETVRALAPRVRDVAASIIDRRG